MPIIGKVVKAHGIRGDLKVKSFMDSPDCFKKIKHISFGDSRFEVERVKIDKDFVLLKVKGIEDMTSAELYRDKEILCEKDELPLLGKNRYYIDDIIGCFVYAGEKMIGKIVDVLQYGSADVILVHGAKKIMFPWIKDLDAVIDLKAKTFRVKRDVFDEVMTDED